MTDGGERERAPVPATSSSICCSLRSLQPSEPLTHQDTFLLRPEAARLATLTQPGQTEEVQNLPQMATVRLTEPVRIINLLKTAIFVCPTFCNFHFLRSASLHCFCISSVSKNSNLQKPLKLEAIRTSSYSL